MELQCVDCGARGIYEDDEDKPRWERGDPDCLHNGYVKVSCGYKYTPIAPQDIISICPICGAPRIKGLPHPKIMFCKKEDGVVMEFESPSEAQQYQRTLIQVISIETNKALILVERLLQLTKIQKQITGEPK